MKKGADRTAPEEMQKHSGQQSGKAAGRWLKNMTGENMRHFIVLAVLVIALSATTAMAAGPYIGAAGGVSFFNDTDVSNNWSAFNSSVGKFALSYEPGYAFQVSSGYCFDNNIRLEGEVGYKAAKQTRDLLIITTTTSGISTSTRFFDDSSLRILSFMLNGFYDIKIAPEYPVIPFVGGGLGLLRGSFDRLAGHVSTDTALGYQLSAGASYRVTKAVDLVLSYRFEGAANGFNLDDTEISYRSSNVLAGVRYRFR